MMIKKLSELLNLDKPLVIFDLETTGLAISVDKILRLAYCKIMPNGRYTEGDILFNPEMEIPAEASEIHGITNNEVVGHPTFKMKSKELWGIFSDCYYSGFNVGNFDLPVLRREFLRVGMDLDYPEEMVIDIKDIYHYMEPRTLSGTYHYYCKKDYDNTLNTQQNVNASAEILFEQARKYGAESIKKVHEYREDIRNAKEKKFYWRDGEPYFAFSRFRHKPISEIVEQDRGFLEWIISANFTGRVKNIVKNALIRKSK
ncbi:MAG: 3'-5' exonuclease [bacterium]